jgi:SUMO ligase MMS21 Smc5/6 complex component
MKKNIMFTFAITVLTLISANAYSQSTNQWGKPVWGGQLSISLTNLVIFANSKINLQCVITNGSTNNICFIQTDSRGVFKVVLVDDVGQTTIINDPINAPDSSEKMGGVRFGESVSGSVPLLFNDKIKTGHYRIIAKQVIYLVVDFNRKNMSREELVSNPIDVQIK